MNQNPESSSAAPQASKAGEEKILADKGSVPEAAHVRQKALSAWQPIATAPRDGTRFIGRQLILATYRNRFETKDRYSKCITWWGKTHAFALNPMFGWVRGNPKNLGLWEPTHWRVST